MQACSYHKALTVLSLSIVSVIMSGCIQNQKEGLPKKSLKNSSITSIRNIHFDEVLNKDSQMIADQQLICGRVKPVIIGNVQYGDLNGDGSEEAVVDAFSCASGTGGADITAVFKLTSSGQLVRMPFPLYPSSTIAYPASMITQNAIPKGMEIMGHVHHMILHLKLVELLPLYKNTDGNCCPSTGKQLEIMYQWNGKAFVEASAQPVSDTGQ